MDRHRLGTGSRPRPRTIQQRNNSAIQRNADECYGLGPVAPDLSIENLPAVYVFFRPQIIDSWTRPRDDIGDTETPFRQPIVVLVSDRLRHQSRFGQQFPESIGVSRKMMPRYRRAHTGVDTDKQDAKFRPDAIAQTEFGPI